MNGMVIDGHEMMLTRMDQRSVSVDCLEADTLVRNHFSSDLGGGPSSGRSWCLSRAARVAISFRHCSIPYQPPKYHQPP